MWFKSCGNCITFRNFLFPSRVRYFPLYPSMVFDRSSGRISAPEYFCFGVDIGGFGLFLLTWGLSTIPLTYCKLMFPEMLLEDIRRFSIKIIFTDVSVNFILLLICVFPEYSRIPETSLLLEALSVSCKTHLFAILILSLFCLSHRFKYYLKWRSSGQIRNRIS